MKQEVAGGVALLALATLYLVGAAGIPQSTLSDEIGARGMPYLLGILLAIVSVAIIARGVLVRAPDVTGKDDELSPVIRAVGVLACSALYIAVAWLAGYVIATAITLFAVMVYEGAKPGPRVIAIAIAGAVFFWLSFVYFLGVEQPIGKIFGA